MSDNRSFSRVMINATATDEASVVFSPDSGMDKVPAGGITHIVEWSTGVTAGVVEIEGCHSSASYAGTWAPITTFTYASGAPKAEYVFSPALFPHIRHRISTAIANGTVTTRIAGAL